MGLYRGKDTIFLDILRYLEYSIFNYLVASRANPEKLIYVNYRYRRTQIGGQRVQIAQKVMEITHSLLNKFNLFNPLVLLCICYYLPAFSALTNSGNSLHNGSVKSHHSRASALCEGRSEVISFLNFSSSRCSSLTSSS